MTGPDRRPSPPWRRLTAAFLLVLADGLAAQSAQWDGLVPGPHAAGFRMVETRDRGRAERPAVDFTGRRATGDIGTPMQLGIWYPAVRPGTAPMSFLDLTIAVAHREEFGTPTAADSAAARQSVVRMGPMAGIDPERVAAGVDQALAQPTASYRGAAAAAGSFPVAVIAAGGWVGATTVMAEYLATRGWIVVVTASQTVRSSGLQVTEPALAVDGGVNAIEFAVSHAATLPGADPGRLALIGMNFDSFSALEYQMRYLAAAAVVTINGWETIEDRAAVLRASPWYDPARLRVPVFNVHWDQRGAAPANLAFLEGLRYADRRHLVIRGLDHPGLLLNPLAYPFTSERHRVGQQYLIRAVHSTIARAVGGPDDGFLARPPAEAGLPDGLAVSWHHPALPAVPTRAEFFAILGDQMDLAAATRLFREARVHDSTVQLFALSDMNLAAFRFRSAGRPDDAVMVLRLAVEGSPKSHLARNALGNELLASADTAAALREFEAALALLDRAELPPEEKAEQAGIWREKVARLRPPARRP